MAVPSVCCVFAIRSSEPSLFYQPGKTGYYSPRTIQTKVSSFRLNAYRNVGRMIGLCILHTEVMPLTLCRHIFKFLANRQVRGQIYNYLSSYSVLPNIMGRGEGRGGGGEEGEGKGGYIYLPGPGVQQYCNF
jgi:hypothetical protein